MGTDPVTCNALITRTIYDPTKEFADLFPVEKPTEIPIVRYTMEIMQHRIDVITNSHRSARFPSRYNQFKDQITQEIHTELETATVVPSTSRNAIGMFTQPTRDKQHEARFLLNRVPRNHVTQKDITPMPSMEQIIDFAGSRPFRSQLDLTDGYHNIRIHPESVKDTNFSYHMGKYDCRVMQQGDCNA